jgi:SAM-dependent methyltransferase
MKFDLEVGCNLCGGNKYKKLYGKEYKGDFFQLVECLGCGLNYINPQPTDESLDFFYDFVLYSEEWLSQFPDSLNSHYYEERTETGLKGYKTYVETVERYIKGGNSLDVGCGDAPLLKLMNPNRWKMFGIDVSQKAFDYHKDNPSIHFYHGTIETAPYEDSFFDAVFSFDAIEHVKDPMSFLKAIARVTKPGGILCINTVNIENKIAKNEKERWVQFTPPGHLYYFSPKIMKNYLDKAGFRIIKFDMRMPLFKFTENSPLNQPGQKDTPLSSERHRNITRFVQALKPVLLPPYDLLCQLKGRLIGKHDITVYALKR